MLSPSMTGATTEGWNPKHVGNEYQAIEHSDGRWSRTYFTVHWLSRWIMPFIFIFMLTQLYYRCWRVMASSAEWAVKGTGCFQSTTGRIWPAAPAISQCQTYRVLEGCEDGSAVGSNDINSTTLEETSGEPAESSSSAVTGVECSEGN